MPETPRNGTLKLGVILDGAGTTADGWRRPDIQADASVDIGWYVAQAQQAEAMLLDFIFIADSLAITAESAPHLLNRLEPVTLLSAVAALTTHIGLVATISTLFAEPFTVARQLASLDIISNGRTAWNVVTSAVPAASLNHSRSGDFGFTDRYRRASEHVAACRALWDSWEADAFLYDKASGRFFDPDKLHATNFTGEYYSARGPLTIQLSQQGHPVLFQAGASDEGRELAAQFGDAIFAMASNLEAAQEYSYDVRDRARRYGRGSDDIVFMPRISPIVAQTAAQVDDIYRETTKLARIEEALSALGAFLGRDFTGDRLEAPLMVSDLPLQKTDIDPGGADLLAYIEKTSPEQFLVDAQRRRLTLREAALEFRTPRTEFMGTPDHVAGAVERWFQARAADGFIIRGGDFEGFAKLCIPILQERGLFRTDYDAQTLRGHLGLPPSVNRYAAKPMPTAATAIHAC